MSLVLTLLLAAQFDPMNPGAAAPSPDPDADQGDGKRFPPPGSRPATYPAGHFWPTNTRPLTEMAGLEFDDSIPDMRTTFDRAVITCPVSCNVKEVFDARPETFIDHRVRERDYLWLEHKVAAMKVGGSWTWKGVKTTGAIKVEGAHDIGVWPCRQVRWTLTRPDGGKAAERTGLICKGLRMGETKPDWETVF